MKEPPIEFPPAVRNSIVPVAIVLVIGISIHRLIVSEQRHTAVQTTLQQICTLQSLYRMNHRFYSSSLEELGLFKTNDGYTYSVVAADDASFVVQGAREMDGVGETWRVNETRTISTPAKEQRETP